MNDLYPLLMVPHFDRRPWGARDLAPLYDRHVEPGEEPIGEAWLTADLCRIANGPFGGATLGDLCRRFGRDLVGSAARETDRFPLLIKFLFPREKLSVQVHPDDEAARRCGQPCGKTECWYVVDAEPGAQIALGLKPGNSTAQLERAVGDQSAETLLNWIDLEPGDMIYVDAGTVHTLGPGSIILETQQNSNTTYRLYDYGRPRPLQLAEGLAAVKEVTLAGKVKPRFDHGRTVLISATCFEVSKLHLEGNTQFSPGPTDECASPRILVALEGAGIVETPGASPLTIAKGDAVIIPAALREFTVRPQWSLEFVSIALPSQPDEPVRKT